MPRVSLLLVAGVEKRRARGERAAYARMGAKLYAMTELQNYMFMRR